MNPPAKITQADRRRLIFWLQGGYYLITGLWPLIHIPSFLWLTGPKTDLWLVKTVGLLAAVIGMVILAAVLRRRLLFEVLLLAGCAAGALFAGTAVSVMIKRIDAAEQKSNPKIPARFSRAA